MLHGVMLSVCYSNIIEILIFTPSTPLSIVHDFNKNIKLHCIVYFGYYYALSPLRACLLSDITFCMFILKEENSKPSQTAVSARLSTASISRDADGDDMPPTKMTKGRMRRGAVSAEVCTEAEATHYISPSNRHYETLLS